MAKKVLLQDQNNVEILPITRGELILDSSGKQAFHSNAFLATTSQPGLMSAEDKDKLDNCVGNDVTYNLVSVTADGLAPKIGNSAELITTQVDEWVLTSTKGEAPSWRKLPINAFNNTWVVNSKDTDGYVLKGSGQANKVWQTDIDGNPAWRDVSAHIHSTNNITLLTGYTKGTEASDLVATDTLNIALGKLEYKASYAYDWIISVTTSDTDEYINKWNEIVGFLDSVKEETDILDEFVTCKTDQTITGLKTFESNSTTGVSLILKNNNWYSNMATALDFYNGGGYKVPNARIETKMNGLGNQGGTLIFYTQTAHASINPNPNGLVERLRIDDEGNVKVSGYTLATGFMRSDSSDSYLLLGGGGHKAISDFMLKSDELTNNLTTITKTLTVTKDWMDTGIKYTDLTTGTYAIQVYSHATNNLIWDGYWSGIMTWYGDSTNSSEADEILLHRGAHAYNDNTIYLRTINTVSSDGRHMRLQIAANKNFSSATYTFKFKKLI